MTKTLSEQVSTVPRTQLSKLASEEFKANTVLLKRVADKVIAEQPLQILLSYFSEGQWQQRSLAIVMRTPGDDLALVYGYLLTQGVITSLADVESLALEEENQAQVTLKQHVEIDFQQFNRVFASQSGCGVCGQSQLKQLALTYSSLQVNKHWLSPAKVVTLPAQLRLEQTLFAQTGGSHSAGLWRNGKLLCAAEDVGRHNAVDKVIGYAAQQQLELVNSVLVLSGRISFELVQKAVVAGIPVIVAVGAPSDLAIATARHFNQTLIGFTKPDSANVYCGESQLQLEE